MIHCRIVTPEGVYREFETPILNIETEEGQRGILPNHMPLVTMLKIGVLSCDIEGVRKYFAVAGGLLSFRHNVAEIITDAVESQEEIDKERAKEAIERANKRLQQVGVNPNVDQRRAEIALKKALNRLHVSEIK